MKLVRKFFKDILTDDSGNDGDIVSVMGALLILALIVISGWSVIHNNQPFDMQNFGIAGAALLASLGGAYHWKQSSTGTQEPK